MVSLVRGLAVEVVEERADRATVVRAIRVRPPRIPQVSGRLRGVCGEVSRQGYRRRRRAPVKGPRYGTTVATWQPVVMTTVRSRTASRASKGARLNAPLSPSPIRAHLTPARCDQNDRRRQP